MWLHVHVSTSISVRLQVRKKEYNIYETPRYKNSKNLLIHNEGMLL